MPSYDPLAADQAVDGEEMDSIGNLREIPGEEPPAIGIAVTPIPFAGLAEDEEWHSMIQAQIEVTIPQQNTPRSVSSNMQGARSSIGHIPYQPLSSSQGLFRAVEA